MSIVKNIMAILLLSVFMMPPLESRAAEADAKAAVSKQAALRFMPLPPREKKTRSLASATRFYSLKSATRQQPGRVIRSREKTGKEPASYLASDEAKDAPPPSGDRDKLLLYVYDEMR
ncbi:MAG: hypothetical protein SFX19_00460 [Alphaproteobacteria bacterium]|nr:hypothetical protein [Alphaproteobacteria bacterium]